MKFELSNLQIKKKISILKLKELLTSINFVLPKNLWNIDKKTCLQTFINILSLKINVTSPNCRGCNNKTCQHFQQQVIMLAGATMRTSFDDYAQPCCLKKKMKNDTIINWNYCHCKLLMLSYTLIYIKAKQFLSYCHSNL